jgi:hypothetical protein
MNYKVIDYYLALSFSICYGKQSSLPKIPPDIVRFIFSFLGQKQIMNDLNNENLLHLYVSQSNSIDHDQKYLCFHPFYNLPYPNIITIKEIRDKFIAFAKEKNHNISFSHLCCTDKGCVFNIRKEY